MTDARAVTVLMSSELLTLSRACAVLRRRSTPQARLSVSRSLSITTVIVRVWVIPARPRAARTASPPA